MDESELKQLAEAFARELQTSKDLQDHMADHQRRSRRAREMLTLERIPSLTADDLRELFTDSASFSPWFLRDKERGFNARLQKLGIDGLRNALRELVARGERSLSAEDLQQVLSMKGLGMLLTSELLSYRFPDRYWTYSSKVTLPAFQKLGEDVNAAMPRGEKSDPYVYLALQPHMAQVCQALREAGVADVDNLTADVFLWWVKQGAAGEASGDVAGSEGGKVGEGQAVRYWKISTGKEHKKWPEFRDQSVIAVDLEGSVDLRDLDPQSSDDLRAKLQDSGIQTPDKLRAAARCLWTFYREIQPGDHVYAYIHKGVAAWGIVQGNYFFATEVGDYKHRRRVTWMSEQPISIKLLAPELQNKLQRNQTLIELTPEEGRAIEALFPPEESPEEKKARQVFEAVLPDPEVRKMCLDLFADYVLQAHAASAGCWEITLFPKKQIVRLNIGMLRSFDVAESSCVVIDPLALAQSEVATLEKVARVSREGETFKLFRDTLTVWFEPATLRDILPIVEKSYQSFVRRAAQTRKVSLRWRSHSPGVTAYLRRFLGRDVPDPAYLPPPVDGLKLMRTALTNQGLHFTPWQLATFYTALQTKGFVILSGISGTGKTKLAQAFARLLPQSQEGDNWLFVSVRPDWRDSKSLLGYYNPLAGTYEWTDFLRFLLRAERNYRSEDPLAWFVILDEMNLAHVEYYFADLLSVLESGRDEKGWTREPLRLGYPADAQGDLPPPKIKLPPNLYIIGTVNVDETTQAFSPKVLDRVFTLELTEADFSAYPPSVDEGQSNLSEDEHQAILDDFSRGGAFARIEKKVIEDYVGRHPEARARLQALNALLRPHDLHFGYRVFDEIVSFLAAAEGNTLYADLGEAEAAFDAAVLMKVLPKFHGSRGKLEAALKKMLAWCINPESSDEKAIGDALKGETVAEMDKALEQFAYRYPNTAERVRRMLRALYEAGFAAFA